jgi:hypothetical protein
MPAAVKRYPFTVLVLAALLAMFSAPQSATALSSVQYALNRALTNYTIVTSATATVFGGKAQFADAASGPWILVVQTYAPTYGVVSAGSGGSVSYTHAAVNNAQSRCYWYYNLGPVSGNRYVHCWRYAA